MVADKRKFPPAIVPNDKSEIAHELFQAGLTPSRPGLQKEAAIAEGRTATEGVDQFAAIVEPNIGREEPLPSIGQRAWIEFVFRERREQRLPENRMSQRSEMRTISIVSGLPGQYGFATVLRRRAVRANPPGDNRHAAALMFKPGLSLAVRT